LAGGVANLDVRDPRYEGVEAGVHGLDHRLSLRAATDIGLVRGDDKDKARRGELCAASGHIGEKLKRSERRRRKGFAVADDLAIEGPIAVEKNRGPGLRRWW
jgi:hypothetical protein